MDVTLGVYYRPPVQDNDTDKFFFEHLRDTPKLTACVLTGGFYLPEINWYNPGTKIPKNLG